MSKLPSPLLGYNNNVRHKNRVFHIQTEDSGIKYGHIITHLFMDGGRILKSVKTSYAEYLGAEKMADIVREMMKQQHKAMFVALRDGQFDHLVEGIADASQQTKALMIESAMTKLAEMRSRSASQPDKAEASPKPEDATPIVPPVAVAAADPGVSPPPPVVALAPPPAPAPPPAQASPPAPVVAPAPASAVFQPAAAAPVRPPSAPVTAAAKRPSSGATALKRPLSRPPEEDAPNTERNPQEELTLDIEALERAAAAADVAATRFRPVSDLPPPPTNLFREKTATGQYRSLSQPPPAVTPASRPPVSRVEPAPPERRAAAAPAGPESERRYAATRPASIFGQARPQQGKTIFGEDLISDKSLDEVILSYLADDLEPPAEKK